MTTQQHTATIRIDTSTDIIARPAQQGWQVLAVENGRERPLGQSTVLGARRAIHEVLQQRNRAATPRPAGRSRSQFPDTRAATARRRAAVRPLAAPATGPDDQAAAWAALRRTVAQSGQTGVQATRPTPSTKRAGQSRRAPATAQAPPPAATTAPAATPPPAPATPTPTPARAAFAAVTARPAWGVHVTLEQLTDDTTLPATGTAVGEISPALSGALRDALGDRTAGRIRKALRRHGLINRPTVFEHQLTTRGHTQRLRVHITPLDAPVSGDLAAAIVDPTSGLPVRRDLELLGA